jgi:hypothetical protein
MLKPWMGPLSVALGYCGLLFVMGYFSAHAQPGQFGSQSLPWYFSSPQDLQARIDELSKPSAIPTNELALSRELDRIDGEIANANQQLFPLGGYEKWDAGFDDQIKRLKAAQSAVLQLDCAQTDAVQQALSDYSEAFNSLARFTGNLQNVDLRALIPNPIDQNPWAHWRSPMDMMRQG